MAVTSPLPPAMLIDMDETILSAYGKPEKAWLAVAQEFADELGPLDPGEVAAAVAAAGKAFWEAAEAHWRLKLNEARYIVVANGFATLTRWVPSCWPRKQHSARSVIPGGSATSSSFARP